MRITALISIAIMAFVVYRLLWKKETPVREPPVVEKAVLTAPVKVLHRQREFYRPARIYSRRATVEMGPRQMKIEVEPEQVPDQLRNIVAFQGENILFNTDYLRDDIPIHEMMHVLERIPVIPRKPEVRREIYNDSQNAHDSRITDVASSIYRRVKEATAGLVREHPREEEYKEVFQEASRKFNDPQITHLLDYIREHRATISKANDGERDVFMRLWVYAKNSPNSENIMEVLKSQLKDSMKNGAPVCTMGRFTRMMHSLAHMDEGAGKVGSTAPEEIMRRELVDRGGVIWQELVNGLSGEAKDKYMADDGEIVESLRNELRGKLKKEYVDAGLVKSKEFEKLTDWIASLV